MKISDFSKAKAGRLLEGRDIVLSIGVFDGVHKGHQAVFDRLRKRKDEAPGRLAAVITFGTNPKKKGTAPLDSMRLRAQYIESFGVDFLLVIDFSPEFGQITGREFIRLLCTMCRVNAVIVGEDFKCGNASEQVTAQELPSVFAQLGKGDVAVDIVPPVLDGDRVRISSTRIRELVSQGLVAEANRLIGSPYRFDLLGSDLRREGEALAGKRAEGGQRLPADGSYLALLNTTGEVGIPCILEVEGDSFRITADGIPASRPDTLSILGQGDRETT